MPLPLYTARLLVRPLTLDDAYDVLDLYGDPLVMHHWNSEPLDTLGEARAWILEQEAAMAARGFAQWHVSDRHSGEFLGCCGLQPLEEREVELVYAFLPRHWGKGYAGEAAEAALALGFGLARLREIVAISRAANTASLRVMEKLDMRSVGTATYFGSDWRKCVLARDEWLARWRRPERRERLLTERLELRRLVPADLEALLAVFGDPEVMRYVGSTGRPLDRSQLRLSQQRVEAHWRDNGFGPLAVVERASEELVGEAGLQLLEAGPEVEVTYTLRRASWGRGYATEAARACLTWGFTQLGLERIVAVAYPANHASRHVLEKLGMRGDGLQACYGSRLARYVLDRDDWWARLKAATVASPR